MAVFRASAGFIFLQPKIKEELVSVHPSLRLRKFGAMREKSHPNQIKAGERKRKNRAARELQLKELAAVQNISVWELLHRRFLEGQRFKRQTSFGAARKTR